MDLTKIKTYSIKNRPSKVKKADFASVGKKGEKFIDFYNSLPNILAASDFKIAVAAIISARKKSKPVICMFGGHVIKCGLSPLVIDLIERKVMTAVALNGAGIIHDVEIAMAGFTSEDVAKALEDGSFGMARETADFVNNAAKQAAKLRIGMAEAVGKAINNDSLRYKQMSILAVCQKRNVPATAHIAIGADIVHQHPSCDGASLGQASLEDFKTFIGVVSKLGNGGVVLNIGSAVILPEVFLKALNTARNLGNSVRNFTAVNFDIIQHYRPYQNVVYRPTQAGGRGISITGHHEIMLPLLHRAIIENI
jgi:deoxyhypusine synthase